MADNRTRAQKWADRITRFSGSWGFIGFFTLVCLVWIVFNVLSDESFDPYPFLFLNWVLTIISTLQNPIILLSQNRQNDMDRERVDEILGKLNAIQQSINDLKGNKLDDEWFSTSPTEEDELFMVADYDEGEEE